MANTYTTVHGDMWDSIAYKVYGSCDATPKLMKANSRYLGRYIFEAGVVLTLPTIDTETINSNDKLPPWKRGK